MLTLLILNELRLKQFKVDFVEAKLIAGFVVDVVLTSLLSAVLFGKQVI